MSYDTIKNIIREELRRLNLLANKYEHEIAKRPKGSVTLRKRGKRLYAYLTFRKNSKVISNYIGSAESLKVNNILREICNRKQYQNKYKIVCNDIKNIKRTIKR